MPRAGLALACSPPVPRELHDAAGRRSAARWAGWIAAGAVVLFAAGIVASTLYYIAVSHVPVPQADEWFSLALYDRMAREGGWPWRLLEAHNEHRLLFPRLVFFSDYLAFGGRGLFDTGVILLVQGAAVGLFAWLAARSGTGRAAAWGLGGLAAALLFSLLQCENLVWPFQVQFVGVFACASLCCTAFAFGLAADRGGGRAAWRIGVAFALAVAATFTMANGLVSGLALVLLAILGRARPAVLAATAAAAAGSIALFSLGYRLPEGREGAADLLHNLPRVAAFTAGYIGDLSAGGLDAQVALGAAGIALTMGLAAATAFGRDRDPARLALLGIGLFCVGSAAVTAAGRSSFGLDGIQASRYCTGAATFWAATLIHLWSLPGRPARIFLARAGVGALALHLLAACAQMQIPMGQYTEKRAADYGALEDALLLGLLDQPALKAFEEPVEQVRAMAPVLRDRGLSPFDGRDAALFGRPLSDVAGRGAAPMACAGTLDEALANPSLGADGVAVAGTSSLHSRFGRPVRVYVLDADGRIAGFARTGEVAGAWKGYARARPGDAVSAYALSDAGRVCRLGSAVVTGPPG